MEKAIENVVRRYIGAHGHARRRPHGSSKDEELDGNMLRRRCILLKLFSLMGRRLSTSEGLFLVDGLFRHFEALLRDVENKNQR